MRTTISLPDSLYREVERYAKRRRKSRSQLYAEALTEYLLNHEPDQVAECMNAVAAEVESDPFAASAAGRALKSVKW